jgi:hypothetical protein
MTEEKVLNSMDQSKFETDSQVCFCVIEEFICLNKFKFQTNNMDLQNKSAKKRY